MVWLEVRFFGFDGILVDFFIKFWYYFGIDFVDVFKVLYLDSFFFSFFCKGFVNFIFKKSDCFDSRN